MAQDASKIPPPDSPDDRSSDSWHSMQTQKTMAFFFFCFLCRHGFLERIRVSRLCCFCTASFVSFYVSARARRDDTTTVTRLFHLLFSPPLLARFERFSLASIIDRQTDRQVFCVSCFFFLFTAAIINVFLPDHGNVVRW